MRRTHLRAEQPCAGCGQRTVRGQVIEADEYIAERMEIGWCPRCWMRQRQTAPLVLIKGEGERVA